MKRKKKNEVKTGNCQSKKPILPIHYKKKKILLKPPNINSLILKYLCGPVTLSYFVFSQY